MKNFLNSQDKGELSKLSIMASLSGMGYKLLDTVGENHRFDLVIYKDKIPLKKVQCKTGRIKNSSIMAESCSVVKNFKTGKYERRYYKNEIDYFCIFCPENGKCYMVPSKKVKTQILLRLTASKGFNGKLGLQAVDFEI